MKNETMFLLIIALIISIPVIIVIIVAIVNSVRKKQYEQLIGEVLEYLKLTNWKYRDYDAIVNLKSSKAVDDYNYLKFFKENREKLDEANKKLIRKNDYARILSSFLDNNDFKNRPMYEKLEKQLLNDLFTLHTYNVDIRYVSPAGRSTNFKTMRINKRDIEDLQNDPSPLMSKSEYNKYIKDQNQALLDQKQHAYYEKVNAIIDLANNSRDNFVIIGDQEELDKQISLLFDRTVNSIKKIKKIDSDEWDMLNKYISNSEEEVTKIINRNQRILDYYNSSDFAKIKDTCSALMESQKEFNEYIDEKAQSLSSLVGARITRNETIIDDEYNYIRPYKKSITPFTAEVSAQVFASAENNPLDYVVKYFYPNKDLYPEQIQKLQFLVEELETLKDAKEIIDNYKKEYQQYIIGVPSYVLENDEDGFYSKLGFANISENVLTVEYKFSYTSNGGMAQRNFTVPMTEETIVELVNILQSKLTMSAFAKEQRSMMTSKLRQLIKERDNYTCKYCGNSTYTEPNLLLEIDHIIPVAKGGCTVENNLQTLCWKCNRSKSNKIV